MLSIRNFQTRHLLILLFVCFILPLPLTAKERPTLPSQNSSETTQVFVIPVSGDVEPVMAAHIKRAVNVAISSTSNPFIILEMDTFGGRVDAALKIVDTMSEITNGQTIAFVKNKAISAGALISLSCNYLVMRPNTTLGDSAPISFSGNEAKMLGEKFQSPLRAKFRTLARKNGYPTALAESMVTARMEVYKVTFSDKSIYLDADSLADLTEDQKNNIQSKNKVVAKGELLTMDDTEALELDFSLMTATSIENMLDKIGLKNYELITLEQNWAESWGRIIAMISPLLMVIGMAALYTEFKVPGFGFPGIVGLICLGSVLLNQHIVGLADNLELILFALGLVMLGFEVFVIPGFGIAGISGLLLIGVGLVLSFQDFILPDPTMPWQADLLISNLTKVAGALLGSFLLSLVVIRYGLPRLGKIIKGPYLEETLEASHADSHEAAGATIGKTGITDTALRPAGKASFDNNYIDVITEGEFVDKDRSVKIIALKGNRVVVSEV